MIPWKNHSQITDGRRGALWVLFVPRIMNSGLPLLFTALTCLVSPVYTTQADCDQLTDHYTFTYSHSGLLCSAPSKQDKLSQCWFKFGPASRTVGQHYPDIGSICPVYSEGLFGQTCRVWLRLPPRDVHQVLTKCWATVCDAGPTSDQH